MQGLLPTDLFTGTWEDFYTDSVNTYNKMRAADVDASLHLAEKMAHVYPLWPCTEGKKAHTEISSILLHWHDLGHTVIAAICYSLCTLGKLLGRYLRDCFNAISYYKLIISS